MTRTYIFKKKLFLKVLRLGKLFSTMLMPPNTYILFSRGCLWNSLMGRTGESADDITIPLCAGSDRVT